MMGLFSGYYDEMLESERNLQKLLNITSIVCILIALFGVWSMIMLTCEQRRKEIAIRKVFGATVKDILDMFFLEYMTLQAIAALIAFPAGYACMKPWLEQYVVQTEISDLCSVPCGSREFCKYGIPLGIYSTVRCYLHRSVPA